MTLELFGKMILGFFVGLLCGLIPLLYGLLNKNRKLAIVGMLVTALSGILFSLLDKSPFSSIVVAALFFFIIIANNKRNSHNHDDYDDDVDNDDYI